MLSNLFDLQQFQGRVAAITGGGKNGPRGGVGYHVAIAFARAGARLAIIGRTLEALERTGAFRGHYHVLGGTLSALDGVGPDDLNIARLIARLGPESELILALNATVEGQTTAHYIAERAARTGVRVSRLAQGVPIGGELDYLDEGTLTAALKARRTL